MEFREEVKLVKGVIFVELLELLESIVLLILSVCLALPPRTLVDEAF